MIKKFKSVIILSVVVVAIIIPVIVTTITAYQYPLLFSVGSSAVKPILEDFSNIYNKKINNNFDLIVDAGGSSTGIESIAYNYTQIGNTSRSPNNNEVGENGRYNNEWKDNNLKTITLAWDGIAIVYKKPTNGVELNINKDNIWKLYQAMTGWYDGKNLKLNDITPGCGDVEIVSYPRSGGSAKSGTADAFANDSNLIQKENNEPINAPSNWKQIELALKNGQYNFKRSINVTNESNAETWLRVLNDNHVGAITYLSTGFVLNNLDDILNNGFNVALYNNNKMEFDSIAKTYGWVRPINSIISLNDKSSKQFIDFLYWLFKSQAALDPNAPKNDPNLLDNKNFITLEEFEHIGVKPLTIEQIKSMTNANDNWNFLYSDWEINNKQFKNNMQFGAKL